MVHHLKYSEFVDDNLLDHFVDDTNIYARIKRIKYNDQILVVNREDVLKYIGIILAMGMCPQPSYDDYFASKSFIFGNRLIKDCCTHEWFRAMKAAFHFDWQVLVKHINDKNKHFW